MFYSYNEQNALILHDLLDARHELAKLTGYTSFSERAQAHTLLGTANKVYNYICLHICFPTH